MRLKLHLNTAAVLALVAAAACTARAASYRHHQRAHVRFVATSTLLRGAWGYNEDTYLAQIVLRKESEAVLVRLIDFYTSGWPPLSHETLTAEAGTTLAVERDQTCDSSFGEILLRTAPGDPMAILPEPLSYTPIMARTPDSATVLPCYRVLRR